MQINRLFFEIFLMFCPVALIPCSALWGASTDGPDDGRAVAVARARSIRVARTRVRYMRKQTT